jgi:hypothetical protein
VNARARWILEQIDRMEIGQQLTVDARFFEDAFGCHALDLQNATARDRFLSGRIGSAWGCWTCDLELYERFYTIGRHQEGKKRVFVDADRAHLYRTLPSGELVHTDYDA